MTLTWLTFVKFARSLPLGLAGVSWFSLPLICRFSINVVKHDKERCPVSYMQRIKAYLQLVLFSMCQIYRCKQPYIGSLIGFRPYTATAPGSRHKPLLGYWACAVGSSGAARSTWSSATKRYRGQSSVH